MKEERTFHLSTKELRRMPVIRKVIEKELTQVRASELLGLSERQVSRIAARLKSEGEGGLAHRLRGKASNRKISEAMRQQVLDLCEKRYQGFGPTLASEKLQELDGLGVNRETLRQWLMGAQKWVPRRKACKHRELRTLRVRIASARRVVAR